MAPPPKQQAVFFELDGVLMRDPYLNDEQRVSWFEGALDALSGLDPRRFLLFGASSREDIAFGSLRERNFKKVCEQMLDDTRAAGVRLAKIYSCPYHPEGKGRFKKESVFRKPSTGIFKMAQQEFDLNLSRCWMIGHRTTDILAASRAGLGTILVETGAGGKDGAFHVEPHFTETDIRTAVGRIQTFEQALRV